MSMPNPTNNNTHPQGQYVWVQARKETGVAYLLWLFLGTLGVHRFYLGQTGTGATQLILSIVGWATAILLVGFIPLAVVWVWVLVDAFLIPGMVRQANEPVPYHAPGAMIL